MATTTTKKKRTVSSKSAGKSKASALRQRAKKSGAQIKPVKKKAPRKKREPVDRGPSALDAAHKVLQGSKKGMNCQELIAEMTKRKLWTSPGGKTPHATLHAAISREIAKKGKNARFKKSSERGKFLAT